MRSTATRAMLDAMDKAPDGTFSDRYNDPNSKSSTYGPPAAWKPSDYPEWEASFQATGDIMQFFRYGSQDARPYSSPAMWGENSKPEERLLIDYLLPSLARDRKACRAMLSQAWRAEDGTTVPPDQMRDALQTCFGMVNHLQNCPTVIERLVGTNVRNLTRRECPMGAAAGCVQVSRPDRGRAWRAARSRCAGSRPRRLGPR